MKIAVSSDMPSNLTEFVIADLRRRGHSLTLFGALADGETDTDWPLCTARAAEAVAKGEAQQGVVFCFTGTGASIAANKIRGIRAALVHDARTAVGAKVHNHANVLVMSIRATPEVVAYEILDAWFDTPDGNDAWNSLQVERVGQLEV
jgi:ribose 5-phosphate isomerase B